MSAVDDVEEVKFEVTTLGAVDPSGFYVAGSVVYVWVGPANPNYRFDYWNTSAGGVFGSSSSVVSHFIMPAADVDVVANFVLLPKFMLSLVAGVGGVLWTDVSGEYFEGESVSIGAFADRDFVFDCWVSSGGGSFSSAIFPFTVFVMPKQAVTVTAMFNPYTDDSDSGPTPIASQFFIVACVSVCRLK